jgi:hypothetical protein
MTLAPIGFQSDSCPVTVDKITGAAYTVVGDSFKADTPQPWSPTGFQFVGGTGFGRYALHPDGKRAALAATQENVSEVHDQVVFVSNSFDYLKKMRR